MKEAILIQLKVIKAKRALNLPLTAKEKAILTLYGEVTAK